MTQDFKLSDRSNIHVFRALDILRQVNARSEEGIDIKRMGAGQPCFGAPQAALDYAIEMIQQDPIQGYTEALGMPSLRQRIAEHYQETYQVHVDPDHIVITAGSSCGLILDFLAAFDAGDRVLVTTPTYPAYRNILKALNIEVVEIEARAEDDYQPTRELLENCGEKFDGIIINSPANPTGNMINPDTLKDLCAWCDEKGVTIISDEAYHGITYDESAPTAMQFSENVIVLNTFSKYFAMTGWRLGWSIAPNADMARRIKKLAESLFVSAPTISQHLAYKIFDHKPELDAYVEIYKKNREALLKTLPEIGITNFSSAKGAFYVYADIHNLSNDSEAFCKEMLDHACVSTTPGTDFDLTRGSQNIRLCFADSTENILEACARLKNWRS